MSKEKNLLSINNLKVSIAEKVIINGLNLTINHGEVHAIMGPNGSGKSTLAKTLAGHPECSIHEGSIKYLGKEIIDLSVEERASEGIFLGFQYPIEIPGLSNSVFLKTALNSQRKSQGNDEITAVDFLKELKDNAEIIGMDQSFLNRGVSFLLITHYDRLLSYIKPDFVHVLSKGQIIKSGDSTLANQLEEKGYEWLIKTQ